MTNRTAHTHTILNMDETAMQLDHKPGRIIATKGAKYLYSQTSGNRETITVIGGNQSFWWLHLATCDFEREDTEVFLFFPNGKNYMECVRYWMEEARYCHVLVQ